MKGNPEVIALLNEGLCAELTAINQFFIHSKMNADWGYHALAKKYYTESIEEMKHAEMLAERIVYLGGVPVQKPAKIMRGGNLKKMIGDDLDAEYDAIARYKRHIKLCADAADTTTRRMLEEILAQEEGHADTWETTLGVKK